MRLARFDFDGVGIGRFLFRREVVVPKASEVVDGFVGKLVGPAAEEPRYLEQL